MCAEMEGIYALQHGSAFTPIPAPDFMKGEELEELYDLLRYKWLLCEDGTFW